MVQIRFAILLAVVAAVLVPISHANCKDASISSFSFQPADQPVDEDWDLVMANLPNDWRQARPIAKRIAALEPQEGWPVVERHWAAINAAEARREFVLAFRRTTHQNLLDLLAMAVVDDDAEVRKAAQSTLGAIAFDDFGGDEQQMRRWCEARKGHDLKEIHAAALTTLLFGLKDAEGDELLEQAEFLNRYNSKLSQEHLQKAALQAGLRELTTQWLTDTDPCEELVQAARAALQKIDPGEEYARQVILRLIEPEYTVEVRMAAVSLLGHWAYPWVVEPLVRVMQTEAAAQDQDWMLRIMKLAMILGKMGDKSVIPAMIEIIEADDTYETVYGIGSFGLGKLTGVRYDESHDGAWWRAWWEQDQADQSSGNRIEPKRDPFVEADDVADIPTQDLDAAGDKRMRYALIGPKADDPPPADGYKLLIIMPGGSGSPAFHPFVKRIYKHAAPPGYIAIQPVAYQWNARQAQEFVWPTSKITDQTVKFTTEQFLDAIIEDVAERITINRDYIFTLSWSSSGPAAYSAALRKETPITGSIIAMSVFKPETLPPLENASGRPFYIIHSPDDKICPFSMAQNARDTLQETGAAVQFKQYAGGHGWRGPVYRWVGDAITWLEAQVSQ